MIPLPVPEDLYGAIKDRATRDGVTIGEQLRRTLELGLNCIATGKMPDKWRIVPLTIGAKVGYLTVIGPAVIRTNRRKVQLCRCTCGKEREYRIERLKTGETKSCGCMRNGASVIIVDGVPMGLSVACVKYRVSMTTLKRRRISRECGHQAAFDFLRQKRQLKLEALDRKLQHMKEDTRRG